MIFPKLDNRLMCAAEAVKCGGTVADIGTDHAYLPIYLIIKGMCEYAVAADINEGPIRRAALNISNYGLSQKIDLLQTDGLDGIEAYHPNNIFILGMGGELIAKILSEAKWIKTNNVRLILQPMTRHEVVRAYLLNNGFDIINEKICQSGKLYNIIVAEYDGETRTYSYCETLAGKFDLIKKESLCAEYIAHLIKIYEVRANGLASAGMNAEAELNVISSLHQMLVKLDV